LKKNGFCCNSFILLPQRTGPMDSLSC